MKKLPNYKIGHLYICLLKIYVSCTLHMHIFPCLGYSLSVMRAPAHKQTNTFVMIILRTDDSTAYVSKSMESRVVDLHQHPQQQHKHDAYEGMTLERTRRQVVAKATSRAHVSLSTQRVRAEVHPGLVRTRLRSNPCSSQHVLQPERLDRSLVLSLLDELLHRRNSAEPS